MISHPLFWIIFAVVLLFGFVVFRGAPYVPSRRKIIEQAFDELYVLGKKDTLIDVGSGDGVVLRIAAKRGVKRAIGYELNPFLVIVSRLLSRRYKNIEVRTADFWFVKFPSELTIIYLFIVSRDAKRMAKKLQTEANRLEKSFKVITFGAVLPDLDAEKSIGACRLYQFSPLQETNAKV